MFRLSSYVFMPLKKTVEINLLIFAVVLFIQRMAMPYLNYIFIPYLFILTIYFLRRLLILKEKIHIIKTIFRVYHPFLLVSVIVFIAFIFSAQRNILILKDILQIGILLFFITIEFIEIKEKEDYNQFIYYFIIQVAISSGFIAVLGFTKNLIALSGVGFDFTNEFPQFGSSLSNDYNFYCLSNILGIISILFILAKKTISIKIDFSLQILLFILSLSVIFSSSRRGFVFYIVFFTFIVLLNFKIFRNTALWKFDTKVFLMLKFLFILILVFFISTYNSKTLFNFKRTDFNLNFINKTLFDLSYRYGSIFRMDMESVDKLLSVDYDSRYPYTRWGTRIHEEVFPLNGKNVEIVPEGSVGYKMDITCNSDSWNGNAYSYTGISKLYKGDTLNLKEINFEASVYCYVSEDFNGTWVGIAAEGKAYGKKKKNYDLSLRNCWQKLDVSFQSKEGIAPVILYMAKEGDVNFNKLKGYVIFAFPEYKKVNALAINSSVEVTLLNSSNYSNASFFDKDLLSSTIKRIRTYILSAESISDIVQDDTFVIEKSGEISVSRTERWKYGLFIYTKEYSLSQKLIGNGFTYMGKFGKKFGESTLDYPHNPFIDAFLYSGLIGGIAYVYFMFLVVYYYIRYFKYHSYFFVCLIVVLFFSFVSANTHFSIPVFTFLTIIPFFTKYIVEVEGNAKDIL